MDALQIAREEAEKLGLALDEDLLEYVLWEHTGWPSFFIGDPETDLRQQLQVALQPIAEQQAAKKAAAERAAIQETLPDQWKRLLSEDQ